MSIGKLKQENNSLHDKLIKSSFLPYKHNIDLEELTSICADLEKDGYSFLKVRHGKNYSLYCKKKLGH